MQVGVNYPWLDYGWDFGTVPPTWRNPETPPQWYGQIDDHLQHFRNLGITVVRWFILADGLTYGSGADAPRLDASGSGWRFDPPPLSPEFLQHFEELLRRFADASANGPSPLQLLPVLIDFHFCKSGTPVPDPGWVKRGRADAITDAIKRRRFLDEGLDPLLRVSQVHRDTIYAWELINEPEWITNNWHPNWWITRPVDEASMRAFLDEGRERIRQAGFKPTIGFALFDTLRDSGIVTEMNQFHHYPGGARTLARHTFDDDRPAIIGELATASTDAWPELPDWGQTLLNRLRMAADQGYPLAIPWSFLATDRHTAWSADAERDLECFTQGRNCPGVTDAPAR